MKITVRSFSLGLLTASIILFAMYYMIDDTSQAVNELSVEELTVALEEKGYRAISENEFISYSVYLDEKQKENEEDKTKEDKSDKVKEQQPDDIAEEDKDAVNEEEQEEEQEEAKSISFKVESGDVSQDIAKILKSEGIIDDEVKFIQYMENNGYSPYIQIGTFTVNSDMSLKEIAETLTTYPGSE